MAGLAAAACKTAQDRGEMEEICPLQMCLYISRSLGWRSRPSSSSHHTASQHSTPAHFLNQFISLVSPISYGSDIPQFKFLAALKALPSIQLNLLLTSLGTPSFPAHWRAQNIPHSCAVSDCKSLVPPCISAAPKPEAVSGHTATFLAFLTESLSHQRLTSD